MIVRFIQDAQEAVPQDQGTSTAYDSLWAHEQASQSAFENAFLAQDKIFVVLVVVLLIWVGITLFLYRTDRKLARLERSIDQDIHGSPTQD
jgi:CcmD family protein